MVPIAKFCVFMFVIIVCTVDLGYALECVYCNSTEFSVDEQCIKGSVPSKITCSYDTPCFYAVYELGGGGGSGRATKVAYRGCMYQGTNCQIMKQRTQQFIRQPIIQEECRTCNTHLCNSAGSLSSSLVASCVIYILTKLFQ